MRLLIIEDEKRTASYLKKGLSEEGFGVELASDGEEGLELALEGGHDAVILDVNLPGRDGWSVLSELRKSGNKVPLIFLTARDTVPEKVKGLKLGADDYLVKPFAFSELLARLQSLLRRGPQRASETLRVADLDLDLPRRRAQRAGQALKLSPKEFSLLWLLASREGELLSRTAIEEEVWDMNFEGDSNVVDVAIRRLRSKVDGPFPSKLIHTIRGVGYTLKAEGK
jgi:two-component system copper resistance phosphate regulon response regulator CusR